MQVQEAVEGEQQQEMLGRMHCELLVLLMTEHGHSLGALLVEEAQVPRAHERRICMDRIHHHHLALWKVVEVLKAVVEV